MVKSKTSQTKTVKSKSSKVKKTTKGGTKKDNVVKMVATKAPTTTKSTKSTKSIKSTKSTKSKKSKITTPEVVVEETVAAPAVIDDSELVDTTNSDTVSSTVGATDETVSVTSDTPHSRLVTIFAELRDVQTQQKVLQARERKLVVEADRLNTRVGKELGRLLKKANRRKNVNTNSGIMKKHDLSSFGSFTLVQFMNDQIDSGNPKVQDLEKDAAYSRVDCLRAITGHIKEANLQDSEPGQGIYINIDSALETVFPELKGKTGEERLKYRSIMTHLGPHFKAPVSEEVSEVSEGA